jgi:hypothetical protein
MDTAGAGKGSGANDEGGSLSPTGAAACPFGKPQQRTSPESSPAGHVAVCPDLDGDAVDIHISGIGGRLVVADVLTVAVAELSAGSPTSDGAGGQAGARVLVSDGDLRNRATDVYGASIDGLLVLTDSRDPGITERANAPAEDLPVFVDGARRG